jgi:hypothetical protein
MVYYANIDKSSLYVSLEAAQRVSEEGLKPIFIDIIFVTFLSRPFGKSQCRFSV